MSHVMLDSLIEITNDTIGRPELFFLWEVLHKRSELLLDTELLTVSASSVSVLVVVFFSRNLSLLCKLLACLVL